MALEDHSRLMQAYVERAMVDLPSLPSVTVRVIKATESDIVSTSEIEELIGTDAAITTKLLRVVNSAYFGLSKQVYSVSQAVAILGLHQVRNLVLSISVVNALSTHCVRTEKLQADFWERSFGTASCAHLLGRLRRLPAKELELLFVAGLLHDIGVLFLMTQFTTPYLEVIKASHASKEPLVLVERRALHTDHAMIGGMLAELWNFPDDLARLIARHESPVAPDEYPSGACLFLADRLVSTIHGASGCGYSPGLNDLQTSWLGIRPDEVENIKQDVQVQIDHAKETLGMMKK